MRKPGKWLRWRRFLWLLAGLSVVLVTAYWQRDFLLVEIGRAWSVNDPAPKVDAIVVLGGGPDNRPPAAAELYRAGVAPLVLYMDVKLTAGERMERRMGIEDTESDGTRLLLLTNGVPEKAIEKIGTQVASTYDEARAVRDWARHSRVQSIEIVTDIFHTRRARWVFRRELKGTGIEIHMAGIPTEDYNATNWWQSEEGVIAFQNEIAKYLYYQIAHQH
jgi:uncharacterized SAM-binding protein YcdF (DUF218 family)